MSSSSYIKGLVGKGQYSETSVSDWEWVRAKNLVSGEEKPMTGFEIHFICCWKGTAMPASPKEIALINAVGHPSNDHEEPYAIDLSSADEAYERQQIYEQCEEDAFNFARSDSDGWFYDDN